MRKLLAVVAAVLAGALIVTGPTAAAVPGVPPPGTALIPDAPRRRGSSPTWQRPCVLAGRDVDMLIDPAL